MTRALRSFATLIALLAFVAGNVGAAEVRWRELGPPGGQLSSILAGSDRTYALGADNRLFVTVDQGAHWSELASPCSTGAWETTQLRANGELYVHCPNVLRSLDGGLTWSPFGEWISDYPQMIFDPFDPAHMIIGGYNFLRITTDGGASWRWDYVEVGEFMPAVAFDPVRRGRLVGVGTEMTDYALRAYESLDEGRTWRVLATIATNAGACFATSWVIDGVGQQFVGTNGCGFHRSADGRTWQAATQPPIDAPGRVIAHGATSGRLVAHDFEKAFESHDGGTTWTALPAIPGDFVRLAFDGGGIWAATSMGAYFLAPDASAWASRNVGLNATAFVKVAPGADGITVSGLTRNWGAMPTEGVRTLDDGATWNALELDGETIVELSRNPSDARSLAAMTGTRTLFGSADSGRTWQLIGATSSDPRVTNVVPVGPQPGAAWAFYSKCVASGFGGCFWRNLGVLRSNDGGASWGTATLFAPAIVHALTPSPANASVAMIAVQDSLRITRDGGITWQSVLDTAFGRIVADPSDPARWYVYGLGQPLRTTADYGATWTTLTLPPNSSAFDVAVDPANTARLYAVGEWADVNVSDDRGATWRRIVAGSPTLRIWPYSLQVDRGASTILHAAAAQGALELVVPDAAPPVTVEAIEYYHEGFAHYFLTTNPLEIGLLDSHHFSGWRRTGLTINVYPTGTSWPPGVSPVCRFYGRPEYGLDTHFYSASPAECQAVIDRFGAAWILETASAFGVYLPHPVDGRCIAGSTPIYRVYNLRPDVNHRYVASPEIRDAMVLGGSWDYEGYGYPGVAMCAP